MSRAASIRYRLRCYLTQLVPCRAWMVYGIALGAFAWGYLLGSAR